MVERSILQINILTYFAFDQLYRAAKTILVSVLKMVNPLQT